MYIYSKSKKEKSPFGDYSYLKRVSVSLLTDSLESQRLLPSLASVNSGSMLSAKHKLTKSCWEEDNVLKFSSVTSTLLELPPVNSNFDENFGIVKLLKAKGVKGLGPQHQGRVLKGYPPHL